MAVSSAKKGGHRKVYLTGKTVKIRKKFQMGGENVFCLIRSEETRLLKCLIDVSLRKTVEHATYN